MTMTDAEKREAIAKLEKDIANYLNQGGEVKKIKPDESTIDPSGHDYSKNKLFAHDRPPSRRPNFIVR
ncbi:MAG: hypothetical protein OXU66_11600 [Gammaproteobacteria bacterium]|nr:hypothetical protein [Gammaproteobacteria bacterium]MDD9896691.1 hypothetical protein [Gammaproteobacteria bacterium]MDD9959574.1 hypothetical protein [Gammaproteobacteria bacterium]